MGCHAGCTADFWNCCCGVSLWDLIRGCLRTIKDEACTGYYTTRSSICLLYARGAVNRSFKCVMGGIARMDITHNNRNPLRHQIYRSITESGGKHLILTPGCGIRHPFEEETIRYLQKVKIETEALLNK